MLKKTDVIEKKIDIRVQHVQIYQNQPILSLSFLFVLHSVIKADFCNCSEKLFIQITLISDTYLKCTTVSYLPLLSKTESEDL